MPLNATEGPTCVDETPLQALTGDNLEEARRARRQEELEGGALADGVERFTNRIRKAREKHRTSGAGAGKKLFLDALVKTIHLMKVFLGEEQPEEGEAAVSGAGRRHSAFRWIQAVGPEVSAFMAARVIVDGVESRLRQPMVASRIADLMVDELKLRRLKKHNPSLFNHRVGGFTTSNYAHMARSMSATIRFEGIDTSDLEMTSAEKQYVGTKLIDIFISATGNVIERVVGRVATGKAGPKTDAYLVAHPTARKWLTMRNKAIEDLWPIPQPMVLPPLAWGPGQRGGYRFDLRERFEFVRGVSKGHAKTIDECHMPTVYAAVNRLQETAWQINRRVLTVVRTMDASGTGGKLFPPADPMPLPVRQNVHEEWDRVIQARRVERRTAKAEHRLPELEELPPEIAQYEAAWREYGKTKGFVIERNRDIERRRKAFNATMKTARLMQDEPAFWYPWSIDFRGRLYPLVAGLNPQGEDLGKSLLLFAEGKPLGPDGAKYLAIHGANCMDTCPSGIKLARLSLDDRIRWVEQNTDRIIDAAEDPLGYRWWAEAEDPWQFLAFCFEWADYMREYWAGRGDEFVSRLPVSADGTCNGIQHLAALWRDEASGKAVNLVNADVPGDIYETITRKVNDALAEDYATVPFAKIWFDSGLVTRKLVKRPAMTFGYGACVAGYKAMLDEELRGRESYRETRRLFTPEGAAQSQLGAACHYLAKLIWNALGATAPSVFAGRLWLQELARHVSQSGHAVEWTTPLGLRVRQEYWVVSRRQIKTMLAGKVIQPSIYTDTKVPLGRKQTNSVAPNVVHSLDASALMLTVELASHAGIENFAMVHDSYGTCAADAAVLAAMTRQAFVEMYTQADRLALLEADFRALMKKPEKCTYPCPAKGQLDIRQVLSSPFFFC